MVQTIWSTGIVPSHWKKAKLIPILKKRKDPNSLTSYRPISLLSHMAKAMEKLVNNRLSWYFETHGIIANEQAGFRKFRSTSQQVAKLSQHIKDAIDNRKVLTATFIDFKSAYDSVWKENLILKLAKAGIQSNMLNWFISFLSEISCSVRYENSLTKHRILQTGVPRGAAFSCTLFNLYINDLLEELNSVPGINCLLYADDLVFGRKHKKAELTTERTLNQVLEKLESWCDRNNMNINLAKTKFQSFSLAQ